MGKQNEKKRKDTKHKSSAKKRLNTPEAEASLQGQHSLINRQLDLNAKVACIGRNEAEEVAENTTRFLNEF